ncbi:MAG: hypothetical protein Ta2B_11810 [Termitinemataceae bacterium]|nr:MAG: hypothetical protein Ta2B_11810 [Termitinemataceae bacterium]
MLLYNFHIKNRANCVVRAQAVLILLVLIMLTLGCNTQSKAVNSNVRAVETKLQAEDNTLTFEKLPPEVKKYLSDLRVAFVKHDEPYLMAQGEKLYEADLQKKVSAQQYFALLYRIGPYSKDSTWELPVYLFDVNKAKNITYTDFEIQGPVLSLNAVIDMAGFGLPIPCRITLLWRAKDIKIMGAYP